MSQNETDTNINTNSEQAQTQEQQQGAAWDDPAAATNDNETTKSVDKSDSESESESGMTRRESAGTPSTQSTASDTGMDTQSDTDTGTDTTSSESGGSDSASKLDSNANADGGLLADGLSAVDSRLVIGSMVPAYILAGWFLWIAHLHGLHHAPPFMWWGIAALILLPIGVLFGPQILLENASSLMKRSGSDSSHTNRGE